MHRKRKTVAHTRLNPWVLRIFLCLSRAQVRLLFILFISSKGGGLETPEISHTCSHFGRLQQIRLCDQKVRTCRSNVSLLFSKSVQHPRNHKSHIQISTWRIFSVFFFFLSSSLKLASGSNGRNRIWSKPWRRCRWRTRLMLNSMRSQWTNMSLNQETDPWRNSIEVHHKRCASLRNKTELSFQKQIVLLEKGLQAQAAENRALKDQVEKLETQTTEQSGNGLCQHGGSSARP